MKKSDDSWSVSDGSVVGYCLQEKKQLKLKYLQIRSDRTLFGLAEVKELQGAYSTVGNGVILW